jgi:hypothetical protein
MRKFIRTMLILSGVFLSGSPVGIYGQSEFPTEQIHLRLKDSPVYGEEATVRPASVLLKSNVAKNADGSGSLTAVLLLTNRAAFGCQSDPDAPLASGKEFVVGISLYESFLAGEGPERTILHQMLFSRASAAEKNRPVTLQRKGGAAVLYRSGTGEARWQSLKLGGEENGITISGQGEKTLLTFDYSDGTSYVKGRVIPTRCP